MSAPPAKKKRTQGTDGVDDSGIAVAKRRAKKTVTEMTHEAADLFGKANAHFANEELDEAKALYERVIDLCPKVYSPYMSLAMLYEEGGKHEEALKIYQQALENCQLQHQNPKLLKRIAILQRETGDLNESERTYSKVIRLAPTDMSALWDCAIVRDELGMRKRAVESLMQMLEMMASTPQSELEGDFTREDVLKEIAKIHYQSKRWKEAIAVLQPHVIIEPGRALHLDLVNILTECYLACGKYEEADELLEKTMTTLQNLNSDPPMDLMVAMGTCALNMDDIDAAREHFRTVTSYPDAVTLLADLIIKIALAWRSKGEYHEAHRVLEFVASNPANDTPLLWVPQAIVYRLLGNKKEAIRLLENTRLADPQNVEAATMLAELYTETGRGSEANEVVKSLSLKRRDEEEVVVPEITRRKKVRGPEDEIEDDDRRSHIRQLYEKGCDLFEEEKYSEFLQLCLVAFGSVKVRREKKDGSEAKRTTSSARSKLTVYSTMQIRAVIGEHNQLEMFKNLLRALILTGRHKEALPRMKDAGESKAFVPIRDTLKVLEMACGVLDKNHVIIKDNCKYVATLAATNNAVPLWNLANRASLNQTFQPIDAVFTSRTLAQFPNNVEVLLTASNWHTAKGDTKYALADGIRAHALMPDDPLACLLVGVNYLISVTLNDCEDRHTRALKGLSYLEQYRKARGERGGMEMEIMFNLGRAYHQLAMMDLAVECYEKTLELPFRSQDHLFNKIDLRMEAAVNLSLIYNASGFHTRAREIQDQFIVF